MADTEFSTLSLDQVQYQYRYAHLLVHMVYDGIYSRIHCQQLLSLKTTYLFRPMFQFRAVIIKLLTYKTRCLVVMFILYFNGYCLLLILVAEGFRQWTLASNLGPPQNPTSWTTLDRVLYGPIYSQATVQQKYIQVKFPINCCVAQWPRDFGNRHQPQIWEKWLLLNNHTSLGRLGSAALVGSQCWRRTIPI